MTKVVIVGGGAAGLTAAIAAAACGDQVLVLERMDRVGKKILATGNGRCNLMNTGSPRFPGNADFAGQVLSSFGVKEQQAFWQTLGLVLREEDGGRVYPASGQASTVLDVLRLALDRYGVEVMTGAQVTGLHKESKKWQVQSSAGVFRCDRVIVCGGGCAQSKLGSDGSCWPLLAAVGHETIAPRPALTQITTSTEKIRGLSGIRAKAAVQVLHEGRVSHEESGEVLFADYGVSGVCVMQCARFAQKGDRLSINFLQGLGLTREQLATQLRERKRFWGHQPMENLLTGLFVPRLSAALCADAGISWKGRLIASLTSEEIRRLCQTLAAFVLSITGVKGFDSAQVTAGGTACRFFDPKTLASLQAEGLHAAGEVLDVDGDCGGFNLLFAFASGILAGLNGRENPFGGVQ